MAALTWTLTVLSLLGVILNIRKRRECFYIWSFTNACWSVVDFWAGLYAQSALFVIYVGLAAWGIYTWKK